MPSQYLHGLVAESLLHVEDVSDACCLGVSWEPEQLATGFSGNRDGPAGADLRVAASRHRF